MRIHQGPMQQTGQVLSDTAKEVSMHVPISTFTAIMKLDYGLFGFKDSDH